MDSKLIVGLFVILFGISIIVNQVFKIDFPFFRFLLACFVIFIGFKILLGSFGIKVKSDSENDAIFNDKNIHIEKINKKQSYNTVFGNATINLSDVSLENEITHVELNAVFGSMKVILPKNYQIEFQTNGVFGSIHTPNIKVDKEQEKKLIIEANAIFSKINMEY